MRELLGVCALALFLCFGCAHGQRSILAIREEASAAVTSLTPGMTLEAVDKAIAERDFVCDSAMGGPDTFALFYVPNGAYAVPTQTNGVPYESNHLSHETFRHSQFFNWLGANGILERAQVMDSGLGVIATFVCPRKQRETRIPQQPAGGDGKPAPQP
jgi:hypothetical protein